MKIAVEGCAHGELENIYDTIKCLEEKQEFKVDLLICCGDFQSSRNEEDLRCMAVPPKYAHICSFYKYYTGEKVAPILTIFIGGNHEASNYLQELPYGGWVAPNIYYLGYAGVVNIAGIRIGGLSGIYKSKDYLKGHYEHPPYNESTKRSVYHIRNLEIYRLKQIKEHVNIFLSHDWPKGVWDHGNKKQLLKFKPFFEKDINSGELGSKPAEEVLNLLRPDYWFSAHLHCKFAALIPHACGKKTRFLALDKCLPKRRFLQIIDYPHQPADKLELCYDLDWLTILRLTSSLLSVKSLFNYLPAEEVIITTEAKTATLQQLGNTLVIPENFERTAPGYTVNQSYKNVEQPNAVLNPQTVSFCAKLQLDDPVNLILELSEQIRDSIEEDTNCNRTFIDSDLLESSTQRSLILPEPVNETCELNPDEVVKIVPEEPPAPEEEKSEINTVNKFKRRNAAIYSNEEG